MSQPEKNERCEKMAKMIKQKYRTLGGDVKLNCYYITVPKKVVEESGLNPDREIIVKAENNKIVVEQ